MSASVSGPPGPLVRPRVDGPMFAAILLLTALGVVMVGASSAILADAQNHDALYYLKRQAVFAVLGSVALIVTASLEPAWLERKAPFFMIAALVLLVLVLVPGIGHLAGGSRRWINFGPIGVQAGEVAKLALVMFLAASLARKGKGKGKLGAMPGLRARSLRYFLVPAICIGLLLGEPDFGTAVLLAAITFVMLFISGARLAPLLGVAVLAVPLALLAIGTSEYRVKRVLAFLDPWAHRYDIGYQITESLMTVGSGGLFGLGLGESRQKLFFLPAAHTDFVFSIIGEELGFMGVLVVIGAFAVIAVRAWQAAARARSPFIALLVVGLGSLLVLQAAFNIAVTLGLVPTKGITLPFVSYGGSSLVMSMAMAGVLLRATADSLAPHAHAHAHAHTQMQRSAHEDSMRNRASPRGSPAASVPLAAMATTSSSEVPR